MQLDGTGQLLHLKQLWTGSWNLKSLLIHITELLYIPKVELIPVRLRQPVVEYVELLQTSHYNKQMGNVSHIQEINEKVEHLKLFIESFPRIEQLHLNILLTYLLYPEEYYKTATLWVKKFTSVLPTSLIDDVDVQGNNSGSGIKSGSIVHADEVWSDDEEG